ncbi:MAG: hypothetical protein Q4F74_05680, partial [Synergistaceae bacterium]|nr:hypothetical protein [Synergistaceae bacterium]
RIQNIGFVLCLVFILIVYGAYFYRTSGAAESAWDGSSAEPQKNGNGWYLIESGANLHWLAEAVNTSHDVHSIDKR